MTSAAVLAPSAGGVLVASPSNSFREQIVQSLPLRSGPVQEAAGGAEALVKLETGNWQVLFLDRRLHDLDAEELIHIIRRRFPGIEVVLLDSDSGHPVGRSAVLGAGSLWNSARPEIVAPKAEPAGKPLPIEALPGMIGQTPCMAQLYDLARLVAPRNTTVLISGETGTGKELVARGVHQLSPRASRAFVVVNCAAIPEALLESELFGHVRGAFTGATQTYSGRIQAAQGGTLFLDEVGELPLSLQAKLLRFLDRKEIQRLGSAETTQVDVRVIAATNADLGQLVEEGKFRSDLYYRLAAFPLVLPPLRERQGDVPPLAEHFLGHIAAADHLPQKTISQDALSALELHSWPGNVRELQQQMERASILAGDDSMIQRQHLYFPRVRCSRPAEARNARDGKF